MTISYSLREELRSIKYKGENHGVLRIVFVCIEKNSNAFFLKARFLSVTLAVLEVAL